MGSYTAKEAGEWRTDGRFCSLRAKDFSGKERPPQSEFMRAFVALLLVGAAGGFQVPLASPVPKCASW
eukprot:scaffold161_cov124-Pinguiococcus_pyrenoidosus.AAC.1